MPEIVLAEPWRVSKGGGTCSTDEWAVVNRDTGRTMGCHASKAKARRQLAALNANVDESSAIAGVLASLSDVLEASARTDKWRKSATIETRGAERVGRHFRIQGRMFVADLAALSSDFAEARRLSPDLREAPRDEKWIPIWASVARRVRASFADTIAWIMREGLKAGGNATIARLGLEVAFDLQNPRATAYMATRGAELVTRIDETTRGYLRTLLAEATEKGWSYQRTAAAITERFTGFTTGSPLLHIASRAELVAVTETAFAYEQGNRIAADGLRRTLPPGTGMRKAWITAGDNRVDEETCGPNEADGWIPFEEVHTSGHGEPPAHPGCRCTESYEVVAT